MLLGKDVGTEELKMLRDEKYITDAKPNGKTQIDLLSDVFNYPKLNTLNQKFIRKPSMTVAERQAKGEEARAAIRQDTERRLNANKTKLTPKVGHPTL